MTSGTVVNRFIKNKPNSDNGTFVENSTLCGNNTILEESFSGTCLCCLSDARLKSIFSSLNDLEDKLELIYFDMIVNCFQIEMFNDESIPKELYQICEDCIIRLRDAFYFKCQIISTQQHFRNKLDEQKCLEEKKLSTDNGGNDNELSNSCNSSMFENIKKIRKKKSTRPKIQRTKSKQTDGSNDTGKKRQKEKALYVLEKDALTCHLCGEEFSLHSALVKHMPIHFPNYICDVCAKIFASKSKLTKHIALHQAKEYKCDICEKSYKGIDNIRSHIQRHSKYNFYKCLQCPQRFRTYHSRLKHLSQVHHIEPRKYQCKQCSKAYSQGNALTRHVKRVHLQERPYLCTVCGDGFFANGELSEHMRKHTGVKNFKCTVCLKLYGRKYTLNEHMKIHNNEKRFVCPFCGRAFTQKCTLKAHLKTHEKSVSQNQ